MEAQVNYKQLLQDAATAVNKGYMANRRGIRHLHAVLRPNCGKQLDPSFLERNATTKNLCPAEVYKIVTFEPLHKSHLVTYKLLKSCQLQYLSSNIFQTNASSEE